MMISGSEIFNYVTVFYTGKKNWNGVPSDKVKNYL